MVLKVIIILYSGLSINFIPLANKLPVVDHAGQDIFRGDVSCQTHFFRGGRVAKLHLVGGGGAPKSALP